MKRNLLWIAACLLSAAMLVACNGDNGKQPETQDTTSAETVTEAEVDSTDADTAGESETVSVQLKTDASVLICSYLSLTAFYRLVYTRRNSHKEAQTY